MGMPSPIFQVSTLIEWDVENGPARVERILLIEPDENNLALSDVITINADIKDTHALPIFYKYEQLTTAVATNRARVFQKGELYTPPYLPENPQDPKYMLRRDEYFKRRDAAWELIEPLIETYGRRLLNKWERGKIVREHARKNGRRVATICVLLRRYCQRGMTKDALLPAWQNCGHVLLRVDHGAKRGRPPNEGNPIGRNVTEEDRKIFRDGIDEFIVHGGKKPTAAWQLIKEKYYKTGTHRLKDGTESPTLRPADTIPTPRQFEYYYYKNRNRGVEIICSQGETAFNLNNRPLDGNPDMLATRPGAVYQIDATIGDIYLVSHLDRTIIGRPVIYIVIDMFSRLITGLAVTLEGPNWAGARLALECALLNKIEFCQRYGIEIERGAVAR
jgi:putative transposase